MGFFVEEIQNVYIEGGFKLCFCFWKNIYMYSEIVALKFIKSLTHIKENEDSRSRSTTLLSSKAKSNVNFKSITVRKLKLHKKLNATIN